MTILADSSALVALFNQEETNHTKAKQIASRLNAEIITITSYIFAETVTILSQRVGKNHSIEAGEYLKHQFVWIDVDQSTLDLAWEIFQQQSSKNVSFTDCISFALFQQDQFDQAFSFDSDFSRFGLPLA